MRVHDLKIDEAANGNEHSTHIDTKYAELAWLTSQSDELFNRFMPYLSFKDIE